MTAFSNKYVYNDKCKDKYGILNDNYIIDASVSKNKASVRETNFVFDI